MAGMGRFRNQVSWAVLNCFLSIVCLFAGCTPPEKSPDAGQGDITAAEQHKAELLKRLGRKFEDPDAHFQLGQLYHADGQLREARWRYMQALSFEPARKDAQAAMVKVLLDRGEKAVAESAARKYINQVFGSEEPLLVLGQEFRRQGLEDYAVICYRQVLDVAPDSAEAHKQMGYHYLGRNENARAKEHFKISFQLNSNQPDVAGALGRLGVIIEASQKPEAESKPADKNVEQPER